MSLSWNFAPSCLREDPLSFFEGGLGVYSDDEGGFYDEAMRILKKKECNKKGSIELPIQWVPQADEEKWTASSSNVSSEEESSCSSTSSQDDVTEISESDRSCDSLSENNTNVVIVIVDEIAETDAEEETHEKQVDPIEQEHYISSNKNNVLSKRQQKIRHSSHQT
tara:strand:+ start:1970 stop:2467 length:498 start_codon:yes stop_codon:yes gene_type:complete